MNLALQCFIISCCLFEIIPLADEHSVKIKKRGQLPPLKYKIKLLDYAFCAFLE